MNEEMVSEFTEVIHGAIDLVLHDFSQATLEDALLALKRVSDELEQDIRDNNRMNSEL